MATRATALRAVAPGKQQRTPISRTQVESVISRSVASFGVVFGAQTVPIFLGQLQESQPLWLWIVASSVFLSIIVAFTLSMIKRWVRSAHMLVATIYFVALCTWPLAVVDDSLASSGNHWLYYLLTVATASAAIGLSTRAATVYLFLAPAIYGFIRLTPAGGAVQWQLALLDSVYAVILGGAIMIIVTMLRNAASAVDSAQATALERYAHAVRQHATEVERVQVDSIVHDSVLTTLISAARAYSPEAKKLAATMAGNAIGHLREAALVSPDDGSTVRISVVASRVAEAAAAMRAPFEVRRRPLAAWTIPAPAGEAVYAASVQAMMNSLQHAGESSSVSRWITIRTAQPHGIEIEVGDTGQGFSLVDVPTERLGVRVSIIERVANAGGVAEIDSVANEGTVVTIRWPRLEPIARVVSEGSAL
ncbi:MAG: sensor histidine kinase [Microbacteriaceae bacterium]